MKDIHKLYSDICFNTCNEFEINCQTAGKIPVFVVKNIKPCQMRKSKDKLKCLMIF